MDGNAAAEWLNRGIDQQSPETLGGNPPQSLDHPIALLWLWLSDAEHSAIRLPGVGRLGPEGPVIRTDQPWLEPGGGGSGERRRF